MPTLPTLRDVAKQAEVSLTTVSHALSGTRPVSPETRAKVYAAIEQLNCKPSDFTKIRRPTRHGIIGIMIGDLMSPFYALVLRGIEEIMRIANYSIIISSSEYSYWKQEQNLQMLASKSVDGLIIAATKRKSSMLETIVLNGTPIIFVDTKPEDVSFK